jgi:hypothetical protein
MWLEILSTAVASSVATHFAPTAYHYLKGRFVSVKDKGHTPAWHGAAPIKVSPPVQRTLLGGGRPERDENGTIEKMDNELTKFVETMRAGSEAAKRRMSVFEEGADPDVSELFVAAGALGEVRRLGANSAAERAARESLDDVKEKFLVRMLEKRGVKVGEDQTE